LTLTAEGSLVDKAPKALYNTYINNALRNTQMAQKTIASSTGGTITFTKTGLIHTAGKAYSGKLAALEAKAAKAKKSK
jgi:hypothetical protein